MTKQKQARRGSRFSCRELLLGKGMKHDAAGNSAPHVNPSLTNSLWQKRESTTAR